jgi:uncharacterized protein YxeA
MKILLIIFTGMSLIFFTSGFIKDDFTKTNGDKIEVYFDNKLDFNDLVKMRIDLAKDQINVDYQALEFNDQGKLTSIKFKVTSEGRHCGSGASRDLEKGYGFSIDRRPNAQFYFQVGLRK